MISIFNATFPYFSAYLGFSTFWYIENLRNYYRDQLNNYSLFNDLLHKSFGSLLFTYSGYKIGLKFTQYYLKY